MSFQERMSVLGNEYTVPAGTILYRARKYNGIPLVNENEWWLAPPKYVKGGGLITIENLYYIWERWNLCYLERLV